ncbi:hypothetical protein MTR67_046567 [Solanum verrucosum]|uniref:Uncharacterized protein n=1 Tax=Solanum verrucosum TaxID=315347 RepID=A0AAF0UV23_SOLVR|nr:hypothetical protein MTR67_046567 [Solanum verrucosum]
MVLGQREVKRCITTKFNSGGLSVREAPTVERAWLLEEFCLVWMGTQVPRISILHAVDPAEHSRVSDECARSKKVVPKQVKERSHGTISKSLHIRKHERSKEELFPGLFECSSSEKELGFKRRRREEGEEEEKKEEINKIGQDHCGFSSGVIPIKLLKLLVVVDVVSCVVEVIVGCGTGLGCVFEL